MSQVPVGSPPHAVDVPVQIFAALPVWDPPLLDAPPLYVEPPVLDAPLPLVAPPVPDVSSGFGTPPEVDASRSVTGKKVQPYVPSINPRILNLVDRILNLAPFPESNSIVLSDSRGGRAYSLC
jgi:hypothetical protein